MALKHSGQVLWPEPSRMLQASGFSSSTNYQINGSGFRIGWVFPIPETGTIDKLGIRIHTAATPQTCRLGLYTVDGSGHPTTTSYGSSVYGTFTPAATTFSEVTLGTSASATLGDIAAIVLEFDSTAGDLFATALAGSSNQAGYTFQCGYFDKYNGTSWTKATVLPPAMSIHYTDSGGFYGDCGGMGVTAAATTGTFKSGTNPNEYGLQFVAPFSCRVRGVWHTFGLAAAADYSINIYSGTTAIATQAVDGDATSAITTSAMGLHYFATPISLTAGQTYVASVLATQNTSNLTFRHSPMGAAGMISGSGAGRLATAGLVTRNGGAWASNDETKLPQIGLIIDQLDDGASVGGINSLVGGGLVL